MSSATTFDALPVDVVREILARVVREGGGAVPHAARLTCVSRTFRRAVEEAPEMFWIDVDLSHGFCAPTDARMRACAKKGVFASVRRLNLSGCGKLTDATLRTLAESCESLEELTLSGGAFTRDGLFAFADDLAGKCALRSIVVDVTSPKMTPADALAVLMRFIERNAATLERIQCGREAPYAAPERRAFSNASNRLFDLVKTCGELRSLDLTNCGQDVRFPLFELQRGCPLLQELKLNGLGGESGWRIVGRVGEDFEETCWRDLRTLEVAVSMETTSVEHRYGHSNVNDETMILMLYGSIETIETLDITGCTHLGDWRNIVWDRLPVALTTLRCARTPLSSDDAAVAHILTHLCPALEVLELACLGANAKNVTDAAFDAIMAFDGPRLPLRVLGVAGSNLTTEAVRRILAPHSRFANVRSIDLASCRSLARELRRASLDTYPRDNVDAIRRALDVDESRDVLEEASRDRVKRPRAALDPS